jgi:hypothetical protein
MRLTITLLAALAALTLTQAAGASGPSLPALDTGAGITVGHSGVTYLTRLLGSTTGIEERSNGRTVRTATIPGSWGLQLATLQGTLAGLSPNGRVLVLSDNVQPTGTLRARSRFAVIDARTLTLAKTITLRGDFSIDALSPDGTLLYLIHHLASTSVLATPTVARYQVKAYDLRAGALLPGVVADKTQAGWIMAGYPVTRAATSSGRWVYTLYQQGDNYPFVHALDTVDHTAVCVGLPANWTTDQAWLSSAKMHLTAGRLAIETESGTTRFLLNTETFQVTTR